MARSTNLIGRANMAMAARLHFVDGHSQIEVARRMEISTASVSRLLAAARANGIVKIEVTEIGEVDVFKDAITAGSGLDRVGVVETSTPKALADEVGALLTGANLRKGARIAIGWGRTVQAVISAGLPEIGDCVVVPATGGFAETAGHFQINEFARAAATQLGGQVRLLHAPSDASSELRAALLKDANTARILQDWDKLDAAIVGIGSHREAGARHYVNFHDEDASHVIGDVMRNYYDINGSARIWPGQEDALSLSRTQIKHCPLTIGVAVGAAKAPTIAGAIRSGLISALVTDIAAAERLATYFDSQS